MLKYGENEKLDCLIRSIEKACNVEVGTWTKSSEEVKFLVKLVDKLASISINETKERYNAVDKLHREMLTDFLDTLSAMVSLDKDLGSTHQIALGRVIGYYKIDIKKMLVEAPETSIDQATKYGVIQELTKDTKLSKIFGVSGKRELQIREIICEFVNGLNVGYSNLYSIEDITKYATFRTGELCAFILKCSVNASKYLTNEYRGIIFTVVSQLLQLAGFRAETWQKSVKALYSGVNLESVVKSIGLQTIVCDEFEFSFAPNDYFNRPKTQHTEYCEIAKNTKFIMEVVGELPDPLIGEDDIVKPDKFADVQEIVDRAIDILTIKLTRLVNDENYSPLYVDIMEHLVNLHRINEGLKKNEYKKQAKTKLEKALSFMKESI